MTDGIRPRTAFVLLGAVQTLLIATITIVAIALPDIQRDLGLTTGQLALVSAAFGLSFSALLLIGGRIADLRGHRRMVVAGLSVFAAGSAAATVASGLWPLVAARFAQGVGAALTAPAALALVGVLYPRPQDRRRATAVWGVLSATGASLGMLASGVVTTWLPWRTVFALPAVTAAAAALAGRRLLPAGADGDRTHLDAAGAVLAVASLSLLSYGFVGAVDHGWTHRAVAAPLGAGLLALAAFVAVEARAPAPLVPLRLLASLRRGSALATVLVAAGGHATTFFLLTLYLRQVHGWSPLRTSAGFLPTTTILLAGPLAARLVGRFGAGAVVPAGLLVAAAGLASLTSIGPQQAFAGPALAGLTVFPLGMGLAFAGATSAATDGAPDGEAGVVAGLVNTAMEVGPTVGLTLLVALASARSGALADAGADTGQALSGGVTFALAVAAWTLAALALVVGAVHLRRSGRRPSPHRPATTDTESDERHNHAA